jgi:hypothetical protein
MGIAHMPKFPAAYMKIMDLGVIPGARQSAVIAKLLLEDAVVHCGVE